MIIINYNDIRKKFIIYMLITFEVNIMILQMETVGSLSIFKIYSNMKGMTT